VNDQLEGELYDQMLEQTPDVYRGQRIDFYVQRFRSSWRRQLAFVVARGWKPKWRHPILAKTIERVDEDIASEAQRITESELHVVHEYSRVDTHVHEPLEVDQVRQRLEAGWLELDTIRYLPGEGVFALEVRRPWAEVKLFCARIGTIPRLLQAALGTAQKLGAEEMYFTLRESETARMTALTEEGFSAVDADIYVTYEL
jgi:hypothetical protein